MRDKRQETSIEISEKLNAFYRSLDTAEKEKITDYYFQCRICLKKNDFRGAYLNYILICDFVQKKNNSINKLFLPFVKGEDLINNNSFVLIDNKRSPFFESLKTAGEQLKFNIENCHVSISRAVWIKDFIISSGSEVFYPTKKTKDENYEKNPKSISSIANNAALYYGKLNLQKHHKAINMTLSNSLWKKETASFLSDSTPIKNYPIEGGNVFCSINKKGEKFFLVGENVLSESILSSLERDKVIAMIAEDFQCSPEKILIIPQWTYHLDLQMAYLGNGEFIIHSFDQNDFEYNLGDNEKKGVEKTFKIGRVYNSSPTPTCRGLTAASRRSKSTTNILIQITPI